MWSEKERKKREKAIKLLEIQKYGENERIGREYVNCDEMREL